MDRNIDPLAHAAYSAVRQFNKMQESQQIEYFTRLFEISAERDSLLLALENSQACIDFGTNAYRENKNLIMKIRGREDELLRKVDPRISRMIADNLNFNPENHANND